RNACGRLPAIIFAPLLTFPLSVPGGGTEPSGSASRMYSVRICANAWPVRALGGFDRVDVLEHLLAQIRSDLHAGAVRAQASGIDGLLHDRYSVGGSKVHDFARELGAGPPAIAGRDDLA